MLSPHLRHRPPNWRWARVQALCESYPPKPALATDDRAVRQAKQFWVRYRSVHHDPVEKDKLGAAFPELFAAVELATYAESRRAAPQDPVRDMLHARILAEQTPEEIEAETYYSAGTVRWYERLFFDVRDRLRYSDWVIGHVLIPAIDREVQRYRYRSYEASAYLSGSSLQILGYYNGPEILKAFAGTRSRRTIAEIPKLLGDSITQKATRAIMSTSVTRYNLETVIGAALKLQEMAIKTADDPSGTDAEEIGKYLFAECSKLVRVSRKFDALPPLQEAKELSGTAGPTLEPSDADLLASAGIKD